MRIYIPVTDNSKMIKVREENRQSYGTSVLDHVHYLTKMCFQYVHLYGYKISVPVPERQTLLNLFLHFLKMSLVRPASKYYSFDIVWQQYIYLKTSYGSGTVPYSDLFFYSFYRLVLFWIFDFRFISCGGEAGAVLNQ